MSDRAITSLYFYSVAIAALRSFVTTNDDPAENPYAENRVKSACSVQVTQGGVYLSSIYLRLSLTRAKGRPPCVTCIKYRILKAFFDRVFALCVTARHPSAEHSPPPLRHNHRARAIT